MGCDIHAAIEVSDGNGWKAITFPNRWYRESDPDEPKETARVDMGRNYDAFAILANVRNGKGFAGVDTGDGFVPMTDGRGLPDDISHEAREHGCTGDHSDTYVTADELLAYDWTRKSKHRGMVTAAQFEEWDRRKRYEPRPKEYCGDVSGPMVKRLSVEEMRALVESYVSKDKSGPAWTEAIERLEQEHPHTYCQIEWEEPYTEAAGDLWTKVVPLVLKLKHEHKDVRLVMNFDS